MSGRYLFRCCFKKWITKLNFFLHVHLFWSGCQQRCTSVSSLKITNQYQPFIHMQPENAHLKKEKHRPKQFFINQISFSRGKRLPLVSKAQKSSNLGASIGLAFRNERRSEANNCFNHGWSTNHGLTRPYYGILWL